MRKPNDPTAYSDDGLPTVSGQFKMDNGWTFADYDTVETALTDAIVELDGAARAEPGR